MLYGIDGGFGSGKTSYAIKKMMEVAKGNIIFTNIKVDTANIPNVYYFDGNASSFLNVLRLINLVNDWERYAFDYPIKDSSLMYHPRNEYTRFYIFFDESGSNMNANDWKDYDTVLNQYIDQNRKNMLDIYLVSADGSSNWRGVRRYVDWWYTSKPWINFPFLSHFKVIRREKREDDGKTPLVEQFMDFDEKGDVFLNKRIINEYHDWYFQPLIWKRYDDLYKVINDKDKYKNIDFNILTQIMTLNPYLAKVVKRKPELSFLKDKIDIDSIALLEPVSQDIYDEPLNIDDSYISDEIWGDYEISKK